MSEQEAKKVFSHAVSLARVFGGDVRAMCIARGVPGDLVDKFLREQAVWDAGLAKFDWDGSVKKAKTDR